MSTSVYPEPNAGLLQLIKIVSSTQRLLDKDRGTYFGSPLVVVSSEYLAASPAGGLSIWNKRPVHIEGLGK